MRAETLFETITQQLIDAIEAGADEWRMPWHTLADAGTPESIEGRRYRGINSACVGVQVIHRWLGGAFK